MIMLMNILGIIAAIAGATVIMVVAIVAFNVLIGIFEYFDDYWHKL